MGEHVPTVYLNFENEIVKYVLLLETFVQPKFTKKDLFDIFNQVA